MIILVKAAIIIAVIAVLAFCAVIGFGIWLGCKLESIGEIFDPWQ